MPTTTIRGTIAAFATIVLLATACTSSGEPDSAGTDGTTTSAAAPGSSDGPGTTGDGDPTATTTPPGSSVELTATARGVTADTITVGVSMLDFAYLVENNFSPQGWGDQQGVWQAYIDDLNARGGINGRMVEPIYTFYNPIGDTEATAACVEMTEDNEVFAVLGGFVGPAEGVNTCIVGPGNTILVGGVQDAERLEQAQAPWLWPGSLRPRRMQLFVDLLVEEGYLDDTKTVAIVAGKQAENDMDIAEQILVDAGIEPAETILQEATSGDIEAEDANWAVISERLKSSGVDTVLAMGSITSTVRGLSTHEVGAQLLVLDADELSSLGESVEPSAAEGVISINGLAGDELWEHEGLQPCIEIFQEAFPDVELKLPSEHVEGDEQWYNPIQSYCGRLALFELVAAAAGPDLTPESFLAAAESMSQFELPNQPFASIGPGKYDVNDTFGLSIFDSTLGDRGLLTPITELIDTTP